MYCVCDLCLSSRWLETVNLQLFCHISFFVQNYGYSNGVLMNISAKYIHLYRPGKINYENDYNFPFDFCRCIYTLQWFIAPISL